MNRYPRWQAEAGLDALGVWLYMATLLLELPGVVARFVVLYLLGWLIMAPLWIALLFIGWWYVSGAEPFEQVLRTEKLVIFYGRVYFWLAIFGATLNVWLSIVTALGVRIRGFTGGLLTRWEVGARVPSKREREMVVVALQELQSRIDDQFSKTIARRIKAPTDWYVVDNSATEAFLVGSTVYLTRDLIKNPQLLLPLLAHEYGHLNGSDGQLTLALRELKLPLSYLLEGRIRMFPSPSRAALDDDAAGKMVGQIGPGAEKELVESARLTFSWGWQIFQFLLSLSFGGLGLYLLKPFWAWYWQRREYVADNFAAQCGVGPELIQVLEQFQFYYVAVPFLMMEHPPTELRIDAIQAYLEDRPGPPGSTNIGNVMAGSVLGLIIVSGLCWVLLWPHDIVEPPEFLSNAVAGRATQQAFQELQRQRWETATAVYIAQQATATAFVRDATATSIAAATERAVTATHQAYSNMATATAEYIIFPEATAVSYWTTGTAAAEATATATRWTPTPTVTPTPTSTPTPTPIPIAEEFLPAWEQAVDLGLATSEAVTIDLVEQSFTDGAMMYRDDFAETYVLYTDQRLESYPTEIVGEITGCRQNPTGEDEEYKDIELYDVFCEIRTQIAGGVVKRGEIGWGAAPYQEYQATVQDFQNGTILSTPYGVFVLHSLEDWVFYQGAEGVSPEATELPTILITPTATPTLTPTATDTPEPPTATPEPQVFFELTDATVCPGQCLDRGSSANWCFWSNFSTSSRVVVRWPDGRETDLNVDRLSGQQTCLSGFPVPQDIGNYTIGITGFDGPEGPVFRSYDFSVCSC